MVGAAEAEEAEALTTAPAIGATNNGGGEELIRVDTGEEYSTVGGGLKPIIGQLSHQKRISSVTPLLLRLSGEDHFRGPGPELSQNQWREWDIVAIWRIDVLATRFL